MRPVHHIVIVGGGTAGWLAAAGLGKIYEGRLKVTLIESDQIPTVGVGEATIPTMQAFHKLLEIPEQDRKSTRLNSSHVAISYAVFFLIKKIYIILLYVS